MKTILLHIFLSLSVLGVFSSDTLAAIKGHIDNPGTNPKDYDIKGWACQQGYSQSIKVHLYVGGVAGKGKYVRWVTADRSSETGVANACGTNFTKYRFRFALDYDDLVAHGGKSIYVHGISLIGSGNLAITKSGSYTIPDAPSSKILGHIDGIFKEGNNHYVKGWACQIGENTSINVHLYAGGAAGTGKAVKSFKANLSSNSAVSSSCYTSGTNHRFKIILSAKNIISHGGKTVYVHGISPVGTTNLAINQSGKYSMPSSLLLSTFLKEQPDDYATIPSHLEVIADFNNGNGISYNGVITVNGKLRCARTNKSYSLSVGGIHVTGDKASFECGTSTSPFVGKMDFILIGDHEKEGADGKGMGTKAIIATNKGVISLHGKVGNAGFVKLTKTALPDETKIWVSEEVNWKIGDQIVIASSGFDPNEAEKFTIAELDGKEITLSGNLEFRHWGKTENYQNNNLSGGLDDFTLRNWSLDERAEVVNLTRNIKITSDAETNQTVGAQVKVMGDGSAGFISNVEFYKVGQMGKMGSYPFHWHLKGDVTGQYIKESSIHNSFNRCVTIHGTHNALIENNSCYDHFGHGFFMEDGNETGNVIQDNIGILTKRVLSGKHLLISDVHVKLSNAANATNNIFRFAAPATFWITNPNNIVRRNIAAGSEGSGFWMSFMSWLYCDDTGCHHTSKKSESNTFPAEVDLGQFSSNTAHSSVVGITFDGIPTGAETGNKLNPEDRFIKTFPYRPSSVPVFDNLVAYKNSRTGLYYRGQRAIFNNTILADNGVSFFVTYDQELVNSLFVGFSENSCDTDYFQRTDRPETIGKNRYTGVKIYDGPSYLNNVHFAKFEDIYSRNTWGQDCIVPDRQPIVMRLTGAAGRYTNRVKNLSFSGLPKYKLYTIEDEAGNWKDGHSAAVLDLDGSMSGYPGQLLRPFSRMNAEQDCTYLDSSQGYAETLTCDHKVSHFRLKYKTSNKTKIKVTRINNLNATNRPYVDYSGSGQYNKFSMIIGGQFDYRIDSFDRKYDSEVRNDFQIKFSSENTGDLSPLIHFEDIDNSCKLFYENGSAIPSVTSLGTLKAANNTAHFRNGRKLYFKLEAANIFNVNRRVDTYNAFSEYELKCQDGVD